MSVVGEGTQATVDNKQVEHMENEKAGWGTVTPEPELDSRRTGSDYGRCKRLHLAVKRHTSSKYINSK